MGTEIRNLYWRVKLNDAWTWRKAEVTGWTTDGRGGHIVEPWMGDPQVRKNHLTKEDEFLRQIILIRQFCGNIIDEPEMFRNENNVLDIWKQLDRTLAWAVEEE